MISVRDAGGVPQIGAIVVRGAGGADAIGSASARDAGGLSAIFSPGAGFTIDVTPEVGGAAARNTAVAVTTEQATATVNGASGTITYLWKRSDGALGPWTILSPNSAASSFRCSGIGPGDIQVAYFTCDVTVGSVTETSDAVIATVTNYGDLGGIIP